MTPGPGPVVGPVPDGRQPEEYDRLRRRILWSLPTGLYVLGSCRGAERNLMTISWVTQVCLEPKLVAVGIESTAVTAGLVRAGRCFSVSILPRSERTVVRKFAKPVRDAEFDEEAGTGTMHGEAVRIAPSGTPVLSAAAAWIECAVRHQAELGSHALFLGEVTDCGLGAPGSDPGPAAREIGEVLRMEDTRMNYGG